MPGREPGRRVAPPLELGEGQRPLAERLEDQVARSVAAGQRLDDGDARVGALVGEAGAASDVDRGRGRRPFRVAHPIASIRCGLRRTTRSISSADMPLAAIHVVTSRGMWP